MERIILRPYQTEAIKKAEAEFAAGNKHVLLVMPTGCGKTIVFSSIISDWEKAGRRVLVLAHRKELLDQAQDKLYSRFGVKSVIERGKSSILKSNCMVCIASMQGMSSERKLDMFPHDYFDLIIVDEAHHITSDSYQRILTYFPDAYVLGVTATPGRSDDRPITDFFTTGPVMNTP